MSRSIWVTSTAPGEARRRFNRYVAYLVLATAPLLVVVEMVPPQEGRHALLAVAGHLALFAWAVAVARSPSPRSLPIVVGAMGFFGSLTLAETFFETDLTAFDYGTTYGTLMLLSVLTATLATGKPFAWPAALAAGLAAWTALMGALLGRGPTQIVLACLVGVAGVIFTSALVRGLFDQLTGAIEAYDLSTRLQDAIARCSEALLVHSEAAAVHEAVRALHEVTDADYAYVDETVDIDGEPGWSIVAHVSKGEDAYGEGWRQGKYSAIQPIYERMLEGETVVVHTSELEADMRRAYEADGIRSEVTVPIFVAGEFRGSLGFAQYTSERAWSDIEIQALLRAADMVAAYWAKMDVAAALRASNASKDRLLASVSHEIRTPLTAIVGLSEELLSLGETLSWQEMDELIGIIATQSRELSELVEDLLVASRADFGNLSIRRERVDLRAQVDAVLEAVAGAADKSIVVHGKSVEAWADPLRTRQILRNLLSNAIKYGGDRVVIGVLGQAGQAQVLVADDGPGIPASEVQLIFERYYRSADSPTQPGSVGIGLAVSRQLAELMGGSLDYIIGDTQSRFELSLPVPSAARPEHGHELASARSS